MFLEVNVSNAMTEDILQGNAQTQDENIQNLTPNHLGQAIDPDPEMIQDTRRKIKIKSNNKIEFY